LSKQKDLNKLLAYTEYKNEPAPKIANSTIKLGIVVPLCKQFVSDDATNES
jgi:hypothetical protein